ncbi:MAG TPA: hypothetical protein VJ906_01225, partial [Roseovarius sp.]|nr:hypothetical protein [Roseovarius sp.]
MMILPTQRALASLTAGAIATVIGASPALAQSGMNTTSLQHEIVLDGLDSPWDMAFLEDGTMFFTEKCDGLS